MMSKFSSNRGLTNTQGHDPFLNQGRKNRVFSGSHVYIVVLGNAYLIS